MSLNFTGKFKITELNLNFTFKLFYTLHCDWKTHRSLRITHENKNEKVGRARSMYSWYTGRVVASNTRGLRFKSSHWQNV